MPGAPVIIQPDKALRRRVLAVLAVVMIGSAWAVYYLSGYTRTLDPANAQDFAWLLRLYAWTLWSIPVMFFCTGGWLLWQARRIVKAGRFPLPGQRVLRPTPLRTGLDARRLARLWRIAGIALWLLAPVLAYFCLRSLALFSSLALR